MDKVAIILLADTESGESVGRALHCMVYAHELASKGNEVIIIFEGKGVRWIDKIVNDPENPITKLLTSLNISAYSNNFKKKACKYCIGAFGVSEEDVKKAGFDLSSEGYGGHPDIADLIAQGYKIITL